MLSDLWASILVAYVISPNVSPPFLGGAQSAIGTMVSLQARYVTWEKVQVSKGDARQLWRYHVSGRGQ